MLLGTRQLLLVTVIQIQTRLIILVFFAQAVLILIPPILLIIALLAQMNYMIQLKTLQTNADVKLMLLGVQYLILVVVQIIALK
jgi:hypothetical protein